MSPNPLPDRSGAITAASVADAADRLQRALEAIDAEAYAAASELAIEAGDELDALSRRLVRERTSATLDEKDAS